MIVININERVEVGHGIMRDGDLLFIRHALMDH